jgi:glycosyltransferase involved in cell wall biosynthesis
MIFTLLILSLLCAVIPAALFCLNLRLYVPPPEAGTKLPSISILIPARNEAAGIARAVTHALATRDMDFEVVVMDDNSSDATASIVLALAEQNSRVRLERAPLLPPGWNGKQHACWSLAHAARHPLLCFVDADVTLAPDCIARMAQFLVDTDSAMVSGFPRQITVTFLEWLLLPLIHFVLLGFLPVSRMRAGTDPALAAGCGQFLLCTREAYFATEGHSQIKQTMHDGLLLPRLFRANGFRTDLADITHLADCRMYSTAAQVWNGLAKNATEGIAAPARIVPVSLILLLGQVLPFILLAWALCGLVQFALVFHHSFIFGVSKPILAALAFAVTILCPLVIELPRILAARRFQQSRRSALLHPLGILLLLAIQWYALIRRLLNRPITWRNRAYTD